MNSIFASARTKLTAWYLLIVFCICLLFSLAIYTGVEREFQRFERFQIRIQEERNAGYIVQIPGRRAFPIDSDIVDQSRARVVFALLLINGGILIIAGFAGYFLAGKTLKPIQGMVDEQSRFISDASHELRTPLTSLRSEMEVNLRDKHLTLTTARNILKSNLEDVIDLQTLTDYLLELTQYERGGSRISFAAVSLNSIIEEAVKVVTSHARKKKISIEHIGKDTKFIADGFALRELFIVLLENAVKYSKEKQTVRIKTGTERHQVRIEIVDQGEGIPKEDIPYIFDRFYRSDKSRSQSKGYGLGLSIAKKIVDYHSGQLAVKSKEGKGTSFIILLPRTSEQTMA